MLLKSLNINFDKFEGIIKKVNFKQIIRIIKQPDLKNTKKRQKVFDNLITKKCKKSILVLMRDNHKSKSQVVY